MTNHRDPIEAWLSADVEPLLPRSGTFERVHRRARRRKATRAISAAAGAAVIVAAAVTLPQVAKGLFPGRTPAPNKLFSSPSPGKSGGMKSLRPTLSGTALPGDGPALSRAATGARPPAGFRPTSVTFVGNSTGAVLGQAGAPCGSSCVVLAGTKDYGLHWARIGSPPGAQTGASAVSQVRFLNKTDGWAYGPGLYATHDGGKSWRGLTTRGRVIDLSTIDNRVIAVIGTGCTGVGVNYAAGCSGFALFSATATTDRWGAVSGASASVPPAPGGLQITGQHGYLIARGHLYAGLVSGGAWHAVRAAPVGAPPCLVSPPGRGPWLLAPGANALYLVCGTSPPAARQKLALYSSRDDGRIWQVRGAAPAAATSLAVSPAGQLVLATTAGIYFSRDARSWQVATLAGPAPKGGFGFVGMTTSANGVAVPASSAQHEIFLTSDGGQTWRPSVIP